MAGISGLLRSRRFLPLFLTQFMGAFTDNLLKNALVVLITYRVASEGALSPQILVTLAAGIFILPFFLFSATAGQLADKYEKSRLVVIIKTVEVGLMLLATLGFWLHHIPLLLGVLFLMGTQSAFFGPLKYSLLPAHLRQEHELIAGNALVEAGTFLAILTGTIIGGLLVMAPSGPIWVSGALLGFSAIGLASACAIPRAPAADPSLRVDYNLLRETLQLLRYTRLRRDVFLSILGISWFWLVGATFLSQLPTFTKDIIGANAHVVTLFLTVFSVGIGLGSLLSNRLLRGKIHANFVPLAAVAMTCFIVDLFFTSTHFSRHAEDAALIGIGGFLDTPSSIRLLMDLALTAIAGGVYIVPLYAIMQSRSDISHRSRIIAGNNIMNALFMVGAALITALLLAMHVSVPGVFLLMAIANAVVAVVICSLLPDAFLKSLLMLAFRLLFRLEIHGREHLATLGERVMIIPNHVSFLDPPLVVAALTGKPMFAVNTHIAQRWWIKPLLRLVEAFPVDPTNPMATKALIEEIRKGKHCVIFPEGRITSTGALMKIYDGPGLIADKTGATLLPIRIDGAEFTYVSRMKGSLKRRLFPKIRITILPPVTLQVDEALKGRARRKAIGAQLYDVMVNSEFASRNLGQTLFHGLCEAAAHYGAGRVVLEDVERKPITYRQMLTRSLVLGEALLQRSKAGEPIGLMLPNSAGCTISFFALQAIGRVPAMINFSSGSKNILAACRAAQITHILTAQRFVTLARLEPLVEALRQAGITVTMLEDIRQSISLWDKLHGLAHSFAPAYTHRAWSEGASEKPDAPAVILFTSGSEGVPKGVVLSHRNLMANRYQLKARIDFGPKDIVFNALPMFHSFGLTGGTLLPLLSGIRTFLYPSPLHYRIVPELVYDTNATIFFGTDTFLRGYARFAHPYDFRALRYIFAGAEKLKDETRELYATRFGTRILEGYGATETAPALAANTPMQNQPGTVGRLLPGITHRLQPVPGLDEGGQLLVRGPNVMLGYLKSDAPGTLQSPEDGWYDTGDIVTIDADGYVAIQGRTKRFAKIGGEMVSLAAVEEYLAELWPNWLSAVIAMPDAKKGEQLIAVTDNPNATREAVIAHARTHGVAELAVPKTLLHIHKMPLLGSGKTDFVTLKEWVTLHLPPPAP